MSLLPFMIKIQKTYCYIFEYLYLFVMVIYMAQMTPETGRMVGTLSGNPIPFLIPIVLTIILLIRHPISFLHRNLWLFVGVMFIWSVAVCYKFRDFSSSNLSYYFFLFYAIFMAFIHVCVYRRKLFPIYEHIMVVFSVISLCLWGISVLFPWSEGFFRVFPETPNGNNVLYLFHWTNPTSVQVYNGIVRNQGCSWEPGRFAVMLIPAIFINLSREGIKFRNNKKIIILLLALASTFSTTGYSITILLYFIFWFNRVNAKAIFTFLFILLPVSIYFYSLDFMGGKIQDRANIEELTDIHLQVIEYNEKKYGDEYLASLDRFESAYFEWNNFKREPLLGYGRNWDYSWFRQEISENFALTGGLVKTLSQYGLVIAILLYSILFYSSVKISRAINHRHKLVFAILRPKAEHRGHAFNHRHKRVIAFIRPQTKRRRHALNHRHKLTSPIQRPKAERGGHTFNHQHKLAFALVLLFSSISYNVFCVPIFTAFWLYGLFCHK